jgi:hypothetical protein
MPHVLLCLPAGSLSDSRVEKSFCLMKRNAMFCFVSFRDMSRRFAAFECQKSDLDAPAGSFRDILQALKVQASSGKRRN